MLSLKNRQLSKSLFAIFYAWCRSLVQLQCILLLKPPGVMHFSRTSFVDHEAAPKPSAERCKPHIKQGHTKPLAFRCFLSAAEHAALRRYSLLASVFEKAFKFPGCPFAKRRLRSFSKHAGPGEGPRRKRSGEKARVSNRVSILVIRESIT